MPHVSSIKGVGGSTYDHELLDITFDVYLPLDVKKFRQYLRVTIFHEMNHALFIRYIPRQDRQLYWAVLEGLGTVFDRDYAGGEHFTRGGENFTSKVASEAELRDWLKLNLKT